MPSASAAEYSTDLSWDCHAPDVIFVVENDWNGVELLVQEQLGLPRNLSSEGKSRFMAPYMLRATEQWCRGDFHTVGKYFASCRDGSGFCAFPSEYRCPS